LFVNFSELWVDVWLHDIEGEEEEEEDDDDDDDMDCKGIVAGVTFSFFSVVVVVVVVVVLFVSSSIIKLRGRIALNKAKVVTMFDFCF
jgi:hypothetical protein